MCIRDSDWDALLEGEPTAYDWPEDLDENSASSMCYTSGTTGNPKGVAYSHRSNSVSYTHLRAHETVLDLVCRLLLEKKKTRKRYSH